MHTKKRKINSRNRVLLLLLIFCPIVVFSTISSTIIASLTPAPSIEIDTEQGALYEVNDNGELTIRVTGTMIGISIATCNFQLEIPDSFEMDTLADGSPIIELLTNGSAIQIAEEDTTFQAIFALITYDTTELPRDYLFNLTSPTLDYYGYITPQWPLDQDNQVSGENSIRILTPYITSFWAYDSKKGQTEHVKTYIYNPSDGMHHIDDLKYRLKAFNYFTTGTTPWEDWTQLYSENRNLPDLTTVVVHDYLDYLFKASSNKIYGLNRGDYQVTHAVVYGDGWSDSEFPSSEGEFEVTIQSGTHPVFVAHMVDQAFRNSHDEDAFFDGLEVWLFTISGIGSTTLKNHFGIDFHSYVLSWVADSPYDPDDLWEELVDDAVAPLGLSTYEWDHSSGGTKATNHGFDILFGHAWQYNTKDNTLGKGMYNAGVAVRGYKWWIFLRGLQSLNRLTMHEVLHTYYCVHQSGSVIMKLGHYSGGDAMHADTEDKVNDRDDLYDGV